jgi:glycosyl hydrolase family 43
MIAPRGSVNSIGFLVVIHGFACSSGPAPVEGTSSAGFSSAGTTSLAGSAGGGFGSGAGGAGSTGVASKGGSGAAGAAPAGGSSSMGGAGAGPGGGTIGGSATAGSGGAPVGASALIRNDVFWKDTSDAPIYSQGGGVLQVGSAFYWYGVRYGGAASYVANPTKSNSDTSFVAVTVYSSTDLASWKFEGNALTPATSTGSATIGSSNWVGRVGATYNAITKKYVLNGQYLGTPDTTQFFATSDTPVGPFKWEGTQAVITNVANNNCGDQSVFTDDDGAAYVLCSSLSGRSNTYIVPLRPSDFLAAEPATRIFNGAGREGNAMFKYKERYYVCSSDLHGWNASHSYCISAANITGPYGAEAVVGGTDSDFSHVTQTGLFITVKGSAQDVVIFGGDRWSDFAGNGIGFNQWMPLSFEGAAASLLSYSEWSIDVATGLFDVGPGNNYALNPSFEADRVATTSAAGWTSSNGTNVQGGHSGRWSWQLSGASSVSQKLTGLPKGDYTLAVWAKGGAGSLFAKGCAAADKAAPMAATTGFSQVSLTGVSITSGSCEIGVSASGGSVSVDDFTLIKN